MGIMRDGRSAGKRLAAAVLLSVGAFSTLAAPVAQADPGPGQPPTPGFSPVVQHTGKPPTGYQVTFRYHDPRATRVQIAGEWSFMRPTQSASSGSQVLLPAQWSSGDVPMADPSDPLNPWPVKTMTRDPRTGVWSYTVPLPAGVFTYWFYVNCSDPTFLKCTQLADPSNPPWNARDGKTVGSVEPDSDVYVPSDSAYGTVDYWWQAPNPSHGSLVDVSYASPASRSPRGTHPVAIYTPPGYNPHRGTPYPTLYLSHGYYGNEVDWSTQGDAANILDNLIDTGLAQPMVVVMTDFNGFAGDCQGDEPTWEAAYDRDLIDSVIPYVQAHYDVSHQASQRAFAGLSCGGALANSLLFNHTPEFGYYAAMSARPTPEMETVSGQQVAALQKVGILVGCGLQDDLVLPTSTEVATLQHAGIGVFADFVNGNHEYYVWRILLYDFLTRVAFFPIPGSTG